MDTNNLTVPTIDPASEKPVLAKLVHNSLHDVGIYISVVSVYRIVQGTETLSSTRKALSVILVHPDLADHYQLLTNYIDNDYKSSDQNFVRLLKDKKLNGRESIQAVYNDKKTTINAYKYVGEIVDLMNMALFGYRAFEEFPTIILDRKPSTIATKKIPENQTKIRQFSTAERSSQCTQYWRTRKFVNY
jgi:hypothetical protein